MVSVARVIAAVLLSARAVSAQEMKEGWGFQFRQDTFDKSVVPIAMMSESGDSFDKALVGFGCGASKNLVAFFQPERFMMFSDAAKASFRAGSETKEFTFSSGEMPHFGKRLIVSEADSAVLIAIFEGADGNDVPFKTDKKQGIFTSVGSKETFAIMRAQCAM